jgi:hypothetical protein
LISLFFKWGGQSKAVCLDSIFNWDLCLLTKEDPFISESFIIALREDFEFKELNFFCFALDVHYEEGVLALADTLSSEI